MTHCFRYSRTFLIVVTVVSGLFLGTATVSGGVGESAVITLSFPPGARATGTGEAFTGLADDASATYYNPAGLGLSPLANSWKAHLVDEPDAVTVITAKKKRDFGAKSTIWAGSKYGLRRYNGKLWEKYDFYLIEQGDDLESIAEKFIQTDDKVLLTRAKWIIRQQNGIGMKHYNAVKAKLTHAFKQTDSLSADSLADAVARRLIDIPDVELSAAAIYGIIAVVDSSRANTLSDDLLPVLQEEDKKFENLTELKIPFTVAVADSVTALTIDNSDHLWVGTDNGLWRYSDRRWSLYTMLEGLPSNSVTALASGPYGEIAVGTDNGLALYKDGEWELYGDSSSQLPSTVITAVAFGQADELFAGTNAGLVKISKKTITVFDTSDGLLTNDIRALFEDSGNRLWIGGPAGITVFTSTSWKRYRFPGSIVSSFAEQSEKNIWIGTDKGAISYTQGKIRTDDQGNTTEAPPEWKAFHSKNALVGERINNLIVYDKDVWVATERAVNQYDNAERQVSIAFEVLLPAFKLAELWHLYGSLIWPTQDWGTIGLAVNYINMGRNTIVDALGRDEREVRSWEGVFGLSYGLTVREDFSLGINAKYIVSALAPGLGENGEGVGTTFAIDAAILKRNLLIDNFDLGFMFQNMGPHIFYIDRNSRDPIPFTLRMGLLYRAVETPIHDLKVLFDMHKEVVKNRWDESDPDQFYEALWTDLLHDEDEDLKYELQEVNYNFGLEYWYANFVALRTGFLFDYIGERYEWTIGLGVRYQTLNFDYSYIHAPEGFLKGLLTKFEKGKSGATGARNGQWRASFIFLF
ncbi:MAG: PorV/PorQ family protein [Chitinispirillaceae bacterium]|nr:PorV/PorQ family protein [Chitinispirillaceae bacterium]